jgi:hypothetical protein
VLKSNYRYKRSGKFEEGTGAGNWNEELTKYPRRGSPLYGGGNGFWIEHADGSRAKSAHFQLGSVLAKLCPHNDALQPVVIDSPDVTKAFARGELRHLWLVCRFAERMKESAAFGGKDVP